MSPAKKSDPPLPRCSPPLRFNPLIPKSRLSMRPEAADSISTPTIRASSRLQSSCLIPTSPRPHPNPNPKRASGIAASCAPRQSFGYRDRLHPGLLRRERPGRRLSLHRQANRERVRYHRLRAKFVRWQSRTPGNWRKCRGECVPRRHRPKRAARPHQEAIRKPPSPSARLPGFRNPA